MEVKRDRTGFNSPSEIVPNVFVAFEVVKIVKLFHRETVTGTTALIEEETQLISRLFTKNRRVNKDLRRYLVDYISVLTRS